jgi:hypothetical protein
MSSLVWMAHELMKLLFEFNCAECQRNIGEFAERRVAGLPLEVALAGVEQHLTVSSECRGEFLALEKILRTISGV